MSALGNQPVSIPNPPNKHNDEEEWNNYADQWKVYCESWNAHYKGNHKEHQIDGYDAYTKAWRDHWEAKAQPWRIEPKIDRQRQQDLSSWLGTQPDIYIDRYPFKGGGKNLVRADIEWLIDEYGPMPDIKAGEHKRGLDLRGASLQERDLHRLPLNQLRGGLHAEAYYPKPGQGETNSLKQRREEAAIHLERANLERANLERATLRNAHLEGAKLENANLEGVTLRRAHIQGADLRYAHCDGETVLAGVTLCDDKYGCALLADVHWGGADLTQIDWSVISELGDTKVAHKAMQDREPGWIDQYTRAIRANRQLATALRSQGLDEVATGFAYQAQVLRRKMLWIRLRRREYRDLMEGFRFLHGSVFSWCLGSFVGYGYKVTRAFILYLLTVLVFAVIYWMVGRSTKPHLTFPEAIIFSILSFHGRGIFLGETSLSSVHLDSPIMGVVAIEAFIGLFIEICFIAAFTQRFFGRTV